jgi:hypothetical protein
MCEKSNQKKMFSNRFIRIILLVIGLLLLFFGIIGIFIPLLPTTPFLLAAAACFARSSKKVHTWLLHNKWFGSYIKHYHEGKGIPLKIKSGVLFLLWVTILSSIFLLDPVLWIKLIIFVIAILVTFHIVTIKTYQK